MNKPQEPQVTVQGMTDGRLHLTATFPPFKKRCGDQLVKKVHDPKVYGPVGSPLYVTKTQCQAYMHTGTPDERSENYEQALDARATEVASIASTFESQSGVEASSWVSLIEQAIADANP